MRLHCEPESQSIGLQPLSKEEAECSFTRYKRLYACVSIGQKSNGYDVFCNTVKTIRHLEDGSDAYLMAI